MTDEATDIRETPEYLNFLAAHHHKGLKLGKYSWRYLEVCPKSDQVPLVLIPGTSGTPLYFFRLLSILEQRGIRAIAVDIPIVWTALEFTDAIDDFLGMLNIRAAHFLGVSLGGYLALYTAKIRPYLVRSLILCNAFADTEPFARNSFYISSLYVMPQFYLKSQLLSSFPSSASSSEALAAVDFAVLQVDDFSQQEIASRLTLNVTYDAVEKLPREIAAHIDKKVTLLESFDHVVLPARLRTRLRTLCEGARTVFIENAGNFPFLTRHEDIAVAVVVHLRNNGVTVADAPTPTIINGKKAVIFHAADVSAAVCDTHADDTHS